MTNPQPKHELLAATLDVVSEKYSAKTVLLGKRFEQERDRIAEGVKQAAGGHR